MDLLQWRGEERTPRGQRLREQLCGLTGAHAPYPHGQQTLARLIQEALVLEAEQAAQGLTNSRNDEEPTAVLDMEEKGLVAPLGKRAGQGGREE